MCRFLCLSVSPSLYPVDGKMSSRHRKYEHEGTRLSQPLLGIEPRPPKCLCGLEVVPLDLYVRVCM